nr:unnamed protein product [Callosobruchus chinensis]
MNPNESSDTIPPNQQTYSSALSRLPSTKNPTKEQAIVLTSINGIKIHDYIVAVGDIVRPKNILFASRISNNRICMYLSSANQVDQFTASHKTIKIQDQTIDVRRLVTPSDRLVVSNVCPSIPNHIIEDTLIRLGLNLLTSMTYLRVGMPESEYTHILSFRRQIFITPPENPIPDSTTVTYENTTYRIFLSNEGLNCTLCKQTGHFASKCPSQPIQSDIVEETSEISTMHVPLTTIEEPKTHQ